MRGGQRALIALLLLGCREGPAPFAVENPNDNAAGRLTYSIKPDRVPAWGASSDSVYYTGESYPGLPASAGLLLTLPREGGTARVALPPLQTGLRVTPWLTAPAISPDGNSIAFFEMVDVATETSCDAIVCPFSPANPIDTLGTSSPLVLAKMRVRRIASNNAADDAQLAIQFEGRPVDWWRQTFMQNIAHPFQKAFERHGLPVFRASWSPDGTRLVYSDGMQLRIWTIGQTSAMAIAGTTDGVLPAWSPDGGWIAFTKLFRGPEQRVTCNCVIIGAKDTPPRYDRIIYSGGSREDGELMVVRPDGSGLRALGPGEGPAWTPDSRTIVAHRGASLFRINLESGAATEIPNTAGGFEPAVSRDGRFLAFVKSTTPGQNHDVWVLPF